MELMCFTMIGIQTTLSKPVAFFAQYPETDLKHWWTILRMILLNAYERSSFLKLWMGEKDYWNMCSCSDGCILVPLFPLTSNISVHKDTWTWKSERGFLHLLQDNWVQMSVCLLVIPGNPQEKGSVVTPWSGAVWLQLKLLCSIFSKSSSLFGFLRRFSGMSHVGSLKCCGGSGAAGRIVAQALEVIWKNRRCHSLWDLALCSITMVQRALSLCKRIS